MAERALTLLAVVTLLFLPASVAGQTDPPASGQVPVVVELATETIRLYPAIATAGGQVANRAADLAMDRVFGRSEGKGKGAVAKRFARVYLVNLPIAALSHFAAHELGHASRLQEAGASIYDFRVTAWPWPFPIMGGLITSDRLIVNQYFDLSMTAGGSDAALVQEQALADQIYSDTNSNYFNWMLLAYAKLEMPIYTWTSGMSDPFARPSDGIFGDPEAYAQAFGQLRATSRQPPLRRGPPTIVTIDGRADTIAVARAIQRGMWLNLADYALAAGLVRTVGYIRTGERESSTPSLRIGRLSLVPAARFALTPVGLETGVDVRFIGARSLTHVDVRSTETATGERLWGAGVELRPRLRDRWAPQFRADVFQRRGDPITMWTGPRSLGARLEAGAQGPLRIGGHLVDVSVRAGYKTRGYLVDAPERRTLLAGVSMGFRF